MDTEKIIKANRPPPSVPERLPEEDAFLFSYMWAAWIGALLTIQKDVREQ